MFQSSVLAILALGASAQETEFAAATATVGEAFMEALDGGAEGGSFEEMNLLNLVNLDVVSIGSVLGGSVLEQAYDITVIRSDEIADEHYISLPDSFRLRSGFSATHINPAQDQITLRGSNAFQKGTIRLLFNGQSHNFDIYNITPWSSVPIIMPLVERIEVIQGSAPYYGRNAVSGALNVEFKREVKTDAAIISYEAGTYSRQAVTAGYLKALPEGYSFVGAINFQSVDQAFNFNDEYARAKAAGTLNTFSHAEFLTSEKNENYWKQLSLYASLHKRFAGSGEMFLYAGGSVTPVLNVRLPDRICATAMNTLAHFEGGSVSFESRPFDLSLLHQLSVYSTSNRVEFFANQPVPKGFLDNRNPGFVEAFNDLGYRQPRYERNVITVSFANVLSHWEKSSLTLTPEIRWVQINDDGAFGVATIGEGPIDGLAKPGFKDIRFLEEGLLLQLKQYIAGGFSATVELRGDNNYQVGLTYGALGALNLRFLADHSIRLSASYMTRPPEVEELNSQILLYLGEGDKKGEYIDNENLDPEKSLTVDLGVRGRIKEIFDYGISGYFQRRQDVIEFELVATASNAAAGLLIPRYRFANANDLSIVGGHADLHVEPIENLTLRAGVTVEKIIEVEGKLAGREKGRYGDSYLSPFRAYGELAYELLGVRASVDVQYTHHHTWQWPSYKGGNDTFKDFNVKNYGLLGLGLQYRTQGFMFPATVYLVVRNLLDAHYNVWRYDKPDHYLSREIRIGASIEL